jgi:hypothetical protein
MFLTAEEEGVVIKMFKFNLFFDGIDYTPYITYPFILTEKNLNESENTYEIQLQHTPFADPIKPNRKAIIRIEEDSVIKKTLLLLTVNDSVEKVGRSDLYNHKLSLIEFTHILDQHILPDMRISRIQGIYEPTLKDAAEKVLFVAGLDISLSSATATILNSVLSPELVFTRQTALEALRLIFMIVRIIPYMNSFTELSHVSVEGNRIDPEFLQKFGALEAAYDPETYKTLLQTNTSNLVIEGQSRQIIEPKNGFISPRSPDGFAITNDDAIIPTSRPINIFQDLIIRLGIRYQVELTNGQQPFITRRMEDIGFEFFKTFSDFVFEEEEYNTLENITNIDYDPIEDRFLPGRGASLFYKQGEKNIFGLGDRVPSRFSIFPERQAIREILKYFSTPFGSLPQGNYESFPELRARRLIIESKLSQLLQILEQEFLNETGVNPSQLTNNRAIIFIQNDLQDPPIPFEKTKDLEFRITYEPFIETDIRSYLPYKDADSHTETISQQFFNQQNNVVSIEALEELHQKVVNRGRGQTEVLTYLGRTLDDIPELGTKVDNFVLSSAEHTINRTSITSDYSFDEFFAKLNKFVGVLEEYRQFSIPNESLVKRQFNTEIFGKFTTEPKTSTQLIIPADYIGNKSVSAVQFDFGVGGGIGNVFRQTLPAVVTSFNNQVRVEVETETNVKTGDQSIPFIDNGNVDPDRRLNSPVVFTDENGFVETADIRLIEDYQVGETD